MTEQRKEPAVLESICRRAGWHRDGAAVVVPVAGGRRQRVTVEALAEDGQELVRVRSRIGDAAVLNEPRLLAALRLNARLRFGSIAIDGDMLAMVGTLPARQAATELEASVLYLAQKADEFEKGLFGRDAQ